MFGGLMSQAQSLMDICSSVSAEEDEDEDNRATELETIASWRKDEGGSRAFRFRKIL